MNLSRRLICHRIKIGVIAAGMLIPACIQAQHAVTPDSSAILMATHSTGQKAIKGARIFSDRTFVFDKLPAWLSGMDYLETAMLQKNNLTPVTEGNVYLITPASGEPYSQETALLAEGFVKTNYPSVKLFRGQRQKTVVLKKYIGFDKFRLGHISYNGWAVPFFHKKSLPSVSAAALHVWNPGEAYAKKSRRWQGCPSIEKTGQRLWGAWFSGGDREPDTGNYGIVSYSEDGKTWVDPAMIIYHPDTCVRVMDTQLWKDPAGRLWILWTQNAGRKGFDGLWGTWAIYTENPEAPTPVWSTPERLSDGLTRNKPVVLSSGEWLLPSYNWINHQSAIYMSSDKGNSWTLQGGPVNAPVDNFYEHMCVELKNGDLWLLQRNIQASTSKDKGRTWSPLDSLRGITSANSRLYIGRLQSGKLLLIYNDDANNKRKNLTAFLSEDEGRTWPYRLMLDERNEVSYPEAIQDEAGRIYVCYDRSRTGEKEILMATFTEEDILQGAFLSPESDQRRIISKGGI